MICGDFKQKRSEEGLLYKLLSEACKVFLKSEEYQRVLALGLNEVTFEFKHNLPDYKYGLDKVIYKAEFEINEDTGKRRIKVNEMEIFCDIGFLRYFDANTYLNSGVSICLNIVSFDRLSDMRISELANISYYKNIKITGKLETETIIKDCVLIFKAEVNTSINILIDFLQTLQNANIRYQGGIDFYLYFNYTDTVESVLRDVLKQMYQIIADYDIREMNIILNSVNTLVRGFTDSHMSSKIYKCVIEVLNDYASDMFSMPLKDSESVLNMIIPNSRDIGNEDSALREEYLSTLMYCETNNVYVYAGNNICNYRLSSFYSKTYENTAVEDKVTLC